MMDSNLLQLSHRIDGLLIFLLINVGALLALAVVGALVILRLSRKCEFVVARIDALEKANRAYLETYQYALRYWSRVKGEDSEEVAGFLLRLGLIEQSLEHHEEADSLYNRALAIWERTKGSESEEVAGCLLNLGLIARAQGKSQEAESRFRRSLAIRETLLGPDHPEVAESLSALVALHHDREEYVESESLQRRVVAIWGKVLGAEHPDMVAHRAYHAGLLRSLGRNSEAQEVEDRLMETPAKGDTSR